MDTTEQLNNNNKKSYSRLYVFNNCTWILWHVNIFKMFVIYLQLKKKPKSFQILIMMYLFNLILNYSLCHFAFSKISKYKNISLRISFINIQRNCGPFMFNINFNPRYTFLDLPLPIFPHNLYLALYTFLD